MIDDDEMDVDEVRLNQRAETQELLGQALAAVSYWIYEVRPLLRGEDVHNARPKVGPELIQEAGDYVDTMGDPDLSAPTAGWMLTLWLWVFAQRSMVQSTARQMAADMTYGRCDMAAKQGGSIIVALWEDFPECLLPGDVPYKP